jgi:uncharacterized membrane protein
MMPRLLLALSYWLHLVATVTWVGGLVLMALVVTPALARSLEDDPRRAGMLAELRRRFNPLANLSLAVLVVTGLLQLVADPNYDGFLRLSNTWTRAILLKHLAVGGMLVVGAYMQWSLTPAIERAWLLASRQLEAARLPALRARERWLSRLDVALGVLVLLLTALATAQ